MEWKLQKQQEDGKVISYAEETKFDMLNKVNHDHSLFRVQIKIHINKLNKHLNVESKNMKLNFENT